MSTIQTYQVSGFTDKGLVRPINEDNILVSKHLDSGFWSLERDESVELAAHEGLVLIVADGMGGANAGEIASATAIEVIKNTFARIAPVPLSLEERHFIMLKMLQEAHGQILRLAQQRVSYTGMGTTVVLAWVSDGTAYLAWSGDSRACLLQKNNQLKCLTNDHSVVWEMVMRGEITPEQSRTHPDSNIITQSLGDVHQSPVPNVSHVKLEIGDRLLLCSDGLNSMLPDEAIQRFCSNNPPQPPSKICEKLIRAANMAGGADNISVIVLDYCPAQTLAESKQPIENKKWWLALLLAVVLLAALLYWIFYHNPNAQVHESTAPDAPLVQNELPIIDSSLQNTNTKEPEIPKIKIPQQAQIFREVKALRQQIQERLTNLQDDMSLSVAKKRKVADVQEAYMANTNNYEQFLATLQSDSLSGIERIKIENYKTLLSKYQEELAFVK